MDDDKKVSKNRVEYTLSRAFVRSRLVCDLREVELFMYIHIGENFTLQM
jgi:hypothetical protein